MQLKAVQAKGSEFEKANALLKAQCAWMGNNLCLVYNVPRVKILDEENMGLHESKLQLSSHVPTSQRAMRSIHAPNMEVRPSEQTGYRS